MNEEHPHRNAHQGRVQIRYEHRQEYMDDLLLIDEYHNQIQRAYVYPQFLNIGLATAISFGVVTLILQ